MYIIKMVWTYPIVL